MPLLGECTSLTKLKLNAENVIIPTHLAQIIPDDLRLELNFLRISAGKAFRTMIIVARQRQQRYRALCPSYDRPRQLRHMATMNRLKLWRADHDIYDPTLAPSQKIPLEVFYLRVDRISYEKWAKSYTSLLSAFINGTYQQFHLSAVEFEGSMLAARRGWRISNLDYHELKEFFGLFMREMTAWEEAIPYLALPTYDEIVDELYEAVLERVEDGESMLNAFQRARTAGQAKKAESTNDIEPDSWKDA
ncbi:hypothetical protein BJX64DRAFT_283967 [Aspergillus heterothallicus]